MSYVGEKAKNEDIKAHVLVVAPAEATAAAHGSCAGLKARCAAQRNGAAVAKEGEHRHGCSVVSEASGDCCQYLRTSNASNELLQYGDLFASPTMRAIAGAAFGRA